MAVPVITVDTPDETVFKTTLPQLKFTGSGVGGDAITYETNVTTSSASSVERPWTTDNASSTLMYANGKFSVIESTATGDARGIYESYDGSTWEKVAPFNGIPNGFGIRGTGAAYLNGVHVYIGYNGSTSRSGFVRRNADNTFSVADYGLSINYGPKDIAQGNGMLVAVGARNTIVNNNRDLIMTSVDGVNWTERDMSSGSPTSTAGFGSVCFDGEKFLAVSAGSSNYYWAESEDGINWTYHNGPITTNLTVNSVAGGDGVYVVCGVYSSSGGYRLARSTDGITWAPVGPTSWPSASRGNLRKIIFDNGVFTAVGGYMTSDQYFYRSFDAGLTWIRLPVINSGMFNAVAAGNGSTVVAGSDAGVIPTVHASSIVEGSFVDLVNGSTTDPFDNGNQVGYKEPSGFRSGTYQFRARGAFAETSSEKSVWTSPITFTTMRPPNPGIFMQFLT